MFERLWPGDAQAAQIAPPPREQLNSADLYGRAILVEALARIDQRVADMEENERLRTVDEAALASLQRSFDQASTELAVGLAQLAEVCARITERLDADQLERQALTDALALLAPSIAAFSGTSARTMLPNNLIADRVIADRVITDDEIANEVIANAAEISLVDAEAREVEAAADFEAAEGDDEDDDEISLIDDGLPDAYVANGEHPQTAHSILEQLTDVLNRRGEREALRIRTRLRRASTSQWTRRHPRGDAD